MLDGFLRRENQPQHVQVKQFMEVLGRHLLDRSEFIDAGVVDEDVERTERFLRLGKKALNVGLLGDVRLDSDGLAPVANDLGHDAIGPFLAGRVIDDHRGALGGQVQRDGGSDPLGRAGHHRDFSGQFP